MHLKRLAALAAISALLVLQSFHVFVVADAQLAFLPILAGALIGGAMNAYSTHQANVRNRRNAEDNMKKQEEFAKMGVQWKVDDARKAGIHPLAALGAQTHSFSPISVGEAPNTHMGNAFMDMGQNIQSSINRQLSNPEKQLQTLQLQSAQLDVQGKGIDNAIRQKQLEGLNSPGIPTLQSNSNMPLLTGQGNSYPTNGNPYVVENPLFRTHSAPGQPAQEVGAVPDYGFARTPTGLAIVPSKDVKEKIEDQMIPEAMWAIRNQIMPNFGAGPTPPDPRYYPLPKGAYRWKWHAGSQEFRPDYDVYNIKRNRHAQGMRGKTYKAPY